MKPGRTSFRTKLTIAMMLVVSLVTGLALYLTQRNEQATYQRNLQDEFQSRIASVFGAQEIRQATVSEQCRSLARSVRIRAALEEQAVPFLYKVARDELRSVLDNGQPVSPARQAAAPRASFFLFLDSTGALMPDPDAKERNVELEKELAHVGIGRGNQQIGYIAMPAADGGSVICEVVTTPMIGSDGEMLGALVLGFPRIDVAARPGEEIKTGIWIEGELHMPEVQVAEEAALGTLISKAVGTPGSPDKNPVVDIRGEPYLLFWKNLNPGSTFAPAYEIALYSLADQIAEQTGLQRKILGGGALVLLMGLVFSHFFSSSLSKPVEQLAEDSAQNLALRERAETELEVTEQKYRSIFENAVEGIFLLSPDGRYLSANPAMARILGYASPGELISDLAYPARKLYATPDIYSDFLRIAETEGFVSDFETEVRRKDGTKIWISQNVRVVRDTEGAVRYFEGTLEDITGRRQAADSLREVNTELEKALADLKNTQKQVIQQERLRALGQMASGIAHDFNNALMPVTGFAELLLVDPSIMDDRKKAISYLEIIRTAASDATHIVARLREFYRTNEHSDVFACVDLQRLARQAISLTQPKWKNQSQASGADIRVAEELEEVPSIVGDEPALREVLTNLIFNAVDAMPGGGILTLRTFRAGERGVVEVSDTGMGMSDAVRERCMEPFFSTKGERGTGLGLSMVFGIVQRHEGKIDIRTQAGKGTTFSLSFPLRTIAAETAAATGAQQRPQMLRVLLVDDEPQVRQVLTAFLEKDGHQVQTADHGVDGLRRFLDGKFDVVITDRAMPGMSGDQMAAAIKQFSPKMPVVLLSGFHMTKENGDLSGIDVIVNKPVTLPALRETLCKAMKCA